MSYSRLSVNLELKSPPRPPPSIFQTPPNSYKIFRGDGNGIALHVSEVRNEMQKILCDLRPFKVFSRKRGDSGITS